MKALGLPVFINLRNQTDLNVFHHHYFSAQNVKIRVF